MLQVPEEALVLQIPFLRYEGDVRRIRQRADELELHGEQVLVVRAIVLHQGIHGRRAGFCFYAFHLGALGDLLSHGSGPSALSLAAVLLRTGSEGAVLDA